MNVNLYDLTAEGREIFLEGRRIPVAKIYNIQVFYKESSSSAKQTDVTDELLHRDASSSLSSKSAPTSEFESSNIGDRRSVFLVYGRWHESVEAMREFLGSLDLKVIEWEQAVNATGKANPYISEILDAGFAMAYAAVVLMTPDDVAALHPSRQPTNTQPEPLTGSLVPMSYLKPEWRGSNFALGPCL